MSSFSFSPVKLGKFTLANQILFVLIAVTSWMIAFIMAPALAESHFRVVGMIVAGLIIFAAIMIYLLPRLSYENVLALLILTLPFTDAFLVEVGGSLRICYYFTILALILGFTQNNLRFPARENSIFFLYGYVFYAAISLSYIMFIPELRNITVSGLRGSVYRPYIQFAQLLLMVSSFFVVLSYICFSKENWKKVCDWIFWSLVIVVIYSYYEFFSLQFGLPFLNFVNAPMKEGASLAAKILYNSFLGDQRSVFGILLARPRAFMEEPQFLATFFLFVAPLAYLSAHFETRKRQLLFKRGVFWSLIPIFVAINSRSGLVALGVISLFVLLLIKNKKLKRLSLILILLSVVFAVNMVDSTMGHYREYDLGRLATYTDTLFQARGSIDKGSLMKMVGSAFDIFFQHPIRGVGIGCAPFYYGDFVLGNTGGVTIGSMGNIYANVFSELGLVGLFLFLAFVGTIFFKALNIARNSASRDYQVLASAWLVSFLGAMTGLGAMSGLYTNNYMWVMWAMGAGLVILHKREVA